MKNNENMSDCSSIFVPFGSLTRCVINSVISVGRTFRKPNVDYSERTLLLFLLEIKKQLAEIKNKIQENSTEVDQQWIQPGLPTVPHFGVQYLLMKISYVFHQNFVIFIKTSVIKCIGKELANRY